MSTVELTNARWRKSTRSTGAGDNGNCVEIAPLHHHTAIRDSKNPHGPALVLPTTNWTTFLTQL